MSKFRGFYLLFNRETWGHQVALLVISVAASFMMIQHPSFFYTFPPDFRGTWTEAHIASYIIAALYMYTLINMTLYMFLTFPSYFEDHEDEGVELKELELTEEQKELYRGAREYYKESGKHQ